MFDSSSHLLRIILLVLYGFLTGFGDSFAQTAEKLFASDPSPGSGFGIAVDVRGNTAIVGSGSTKYVDKTGAAYIYRFEGDWVEEQILIPPDGQFHDNFGISVSIGRNAAIVGADRAHETPDGSMGPGAAYIYRNNGNAWLFETKLWAGEGNNGEQFGHSVSILDDVAVVGIPLKEVAGRKIGAVYVYRYKRNGWKFEQKLVGPEQSFGNTVALEQDVLLIGSPFSVHDDPTNSGTAYVYRYNGVHWFLEQQLLAGNRSTIDRFGYALSISGNVIVVGAPFRTIEHPTNPYAGAQAGAAYVFRRDGSSWKEEEMLVASDLGTSNRFGWSVSLDGDNLVIGSIWSHGMGFRSGNAYVFEYNGSEFVEIQKLAAFDGVERDYFGTSVSLLGDNTIIGSPGAQSAYIYDLSETITTTEDLSVPVQTSIRLGEVYPNPAVDRITVTWFLPSVERTRLNLFDASGRHIRTVFQGGLQTEDRVRIEVGDLAPGIYFIRDRGAGASVPVVILK